MDPFFSGFGHIADFADGGCRLFGKETENVPCPFQRSVPVLEEGHSKPRILHSFGVTPPNPSANLAATDPEVHDPMKVISGRSDSRFFW